MLVRRFQKAGHDDWSRSLKFTRSDCWGNWRPRRKTNRSDSYTILNPATNLMPHRDSVEKTLNSSELKIPVTMLAVVW
jgi:hypothetical protein